MPTIGQPENRSNIVGPDGRPSPAWQQWFTALWNAIASRDYFYIPSIDGAPTATPEQRDGFVPMVYDRTNSDFYIYKPAPSAGWKKVTLS